MKTVVAYQGEPGAFSERAILEIFGPNTETLPCTWFTDVVNAVLSGAASCAIMPVENAIAGPVLPSIAAIEVAGNELARGSEHTIPITMCLLGTSDSKVEDIEVVTSHPVALAQCRLYLKSLPDVRLVEHADTAGAAREVAAAGDKRKAAIASELAARHHGLTVLGHGIQDKANNWTRFLIVSPAANPFTGPLPAAAPLVKVL